MQPINLANLADRVAKLESQNSQVWTTLAYLLVNGDQALMAHAVLMGLADSQTSLSDEAMTRLRELSKQPPKPTSI